MKNVLECSELLRYVGAAILLAGALVLAVAFGYLIYGVLNPDLELRGFGRAD